MGQNQSSGGGGSGGGGNGGYWAGDKYGPHHGIPSIKKSTTDNAPSFGEAFKEAHRIGGPGHTFSWQGKLYNTDCADGGNYRSKQHLDNRDNANHFIREKYHTIDANRKDSGKWAMDSIRGTGCTSQNDRERANYHYIERHKK